MELGTFRELYRSRDGRITVFEDAQGHITSVKSSRLVHPEARDAHGSCRVDGRERSFCRTRG